jgi:hypothetical protein
MVVLSVILPDYIIAYKMLRLPSLLVSIHLLFSLILVVYALSPTVTLLYYIIIYNFHPSPYI